MSDDGRSAIDDELLAMTGVDNPRVCFIPTASGDAEGYAQRFEAAFDGRARTSVLSLFNRGPWGYGGADLLAEQDLIYVGGGSTANLLALWRLHGIVDTLRSVAASGTILAGISAGMNCWFEASSTDSYGPLAPLRDGLGFLSGAGCPHYLGEPGRREKFLAWVGDGTLPEGHAVDDFAAVVFRDGEVVEALAERPDAIARRVMRDGETGVEVPLDMRVLGV